MLCPPYLFRIIRFRHFFARPDMIAHDDEYKNHIQRLNVYVERVIGKDAALVFYQKRRADCKRNAGNIGYRLKEQAFFVAY